MNLSLRAKTALRLLICSIEIDTLQKIVYTLLCINSKGALHMSSGIKKTIAFLFFLLAGVLLGTIIGRVCDGVPFLSWLAYTMSVGLDTASPLVLDLIVFKLAFGFTLSVNAAQIICVIISLIVYNKTCKGL